MRESDLKLSMAVTDGDTITISDRENGLILLWGTTGIHKKIPQYCCLKSLQCLLRCPGLSGRHFQLGGTQDLGQCRYWKIPFFCSALFICLWTGGSRSEGPYPAPSALPSPFAQKKQTFFENEHCLIFAFQVEPRAAKKPVSTRSEKATPTARLRNPRSCLVLLGKWYKSCCRNTDYFQ